MDLDKLRSDFMAVRAWMVKYEEWTADEAAEVCAGIGAAVKDGDAGELAFWSDWMDRFAEMAKAHEDQMRMLDRNAAAWWVNQQRRAA
jgi:hypothetical protein